MAVKKEKVVPDLDFKELLENAMIDLILTFPVYAQLISRIGCEVVNDETMEACAWSDGKKIHLNEYAFQDLNRQKEAVLDDGRKVRTTIDKYALQFIICHELMHLISLTVDRGKAKGIPTINPSSKSDIAKCKLWNMATDYEINAILHHNQPKEIGRMPEFGLYDPKYVGMTAEQIYDDLLKECKSNGGGGSGDGDDDESDSDESENGSESGSGSGSNDNGNGNNDPNIPKKSGVKYGIDKHMDIVDDQTKNEIIQKVAMVYGSTNNGVNKDGDAFTRMVNETFKPQPFNWRNALSKYIRTFIVGNYSWNKRSRAGLSSGLILPSFSKEPVLRIAVAVDTSGSISHLELDTMMSHIFTILTQFKSFKIDVWCCGSKVYEDTFRTYTEKNKNQLKDFPIQSDGGNDMRENFNFIRTHYKTNPPDVFICLSDFYDPLDGDTETTSPCPCIFMVIDHKDFVPPSKIKCKVFEYEIPDGKKL